MPIQNHPQSSAPLINPKADQAATQLTARAFVVGSDVSSDDIIGPEYLSFDLTQPDERKMLATYAFANAIDQFGQFCQPGEPTSAYEIIIAGERFGRGSGRHQPAVALNEAGIKVILAKSYGEAFYRTCVNEGALLPLILVPDELDWSRCRTGMTVRLEVASRSVEIEEMGIRTTFEDPGVTLEIAVASGLQGFLSGSATQ